MTRFRPCIDLHEGKVKQIVGGTLTGVASDLVTNFVSDRSAAEYAGQYRDDALTGGHVIMLGPGNEDAALAALGAYSGGLQIGGGITPGNAMRFLDGGASHVIVTSYLFGPDHAFDAARLAALSDRVGRDRLVVDLSCRATADGWVVAKDRWQTLTDLPVGPDTLDRLAEFCAEFLIHAADVEGTCRGIDADLVSMLGAWGRIPITYAGGARSLDDLRRVEEASGGKVDLAIGSALDIFGASLIRYRDCVAYNKRMPANHTNPHE